MRSSLPLLVLLSLLSVALPLTFAAEGPNVVSSLPGFSGNLDQMYTGYTDTNDSYGSQLFYWLAKARNAVSPTNSSATPVVLWLQGGPGCSGGLGWFYENGPYNLNKDQTLSVNAYSWNVNAHLLFIDQPIGTGLSTLPADGTNATYVTDITTSTIQLWTALRGFYQQFPDLASNPLYITGESYAGKYLPNLGTYILQQNAAGEFNMNLRGIALGDGWVAPLEQTSVYGAQAFNLGIIDENDLTYVNGQYNNCSNLVAAQSWQQAQIVCDGLLNWIVSTAGNINVDDVREWGDDEHDDRLEVYLSNPDVWKALSLVNPPQSYQSCSAAAGQALSPDEMKPSMHLLPNLIQSLDMVYLYEGAFDLNCGVVGVEKYLSELYPTEYGAADKFIWYAPNTQTVSGYIRNILPTLTFIIVQDAGHMVPKTQPESAFDMITHLLTNTPFPPSKHSVAAAKSHSTDSKPVTENRSLHLPHLHHVYNRGSIPTSVHIPRNTHKNTPSSSKRPVPNDLEVLTPTSGSSYAPNGVLGTTWSGAEAGWTLEIDVVDADETVILSVNPNVPGSANQWEFGLTSALTCGVDYRVRLLNQQTSTKAFSPDWQVTCMDLQLLEPEVGQLFPQGGSVSIQWSGGSPAWPMQISLLDSATGLIQTFETDYSNKDQYYTATLPKPLDCTHSFFFTISSQNGTDHAEGQPFQVACPLKETKAEITVADAEAVISKLPVYSAKAKRNPSAAVLVEGHAFSFAFGGNMGGGAVTCMEDASIKLTTDDQGYFSFYASVGEQITLVYEKSGYTTTQTATTIVPAEGFSGVQNEVTFQVTSWWVYDALVLILPTKPDKTLCHFCVTVCAYNKTLHDDPQGEPGTTVSISPDFGGTPFYFGIGKHNETNPFIRGLNSTSADGGVLFFNVPISAEPYLLTANKPGYTFSTSRLWCQTPDRFVNGAPPHSPRATQPDPSQRYEIVENEQGEKEIALFE